MSNLTTRHEDAPRRSGAVRGLVRNTVIAAIAALAAGFGLFAPLDRLIEEARFELIRHRPSGDIVVVDIDSASLQAIGVWPWPRTLHAKLLDNLLALGARRVVFDIDFSARTNVLDDDRFAAALSRAKGRVALADFQQASGDGRAPGQTSPLPAFTDSASLAQVDVPIDADGKVRSYWTNLPVGDNWVPTVGALLAGGEKPQVGDTEFGLDYGLDVSAIDHLSAVDVIADDVAPGRLKAKDVIVGASAEELRDLYLVPRFGVASGAALHALAAETLKQGLALHPAPMAVTWALVALIALAAALLADRLTRASGPLIALAASVAIEGIALALHAAFKLETPTAFLHVSLVSIVVAALIVDIRTRKRLHAAAARERDEMRALLAQVVEDSFDGMIVIDAQGRIAIASYQAKALMGRGLEGDWAREALPAALAGAVSDALSEPEHAATPEPRETIVRLANGACRVLEYVITISELGLARTPIAACLSFRDITDRRSQERRLAYLARHDELTGAWTRTHFSQELALRLAGEPADICVFCLDLRRFVLVNEVFGRGIGDELLKEVVERIRALGNQLVARLGGDTFVFTRDGGPTIDALDAAGKQLVAALSSPYLIGEQKIIIGASLGGTTSAISGRDPDQLIAHANMAQDSAKRAVGDIFQRFQPEMETLRREKQAIDHDLRLAIDDGSLALQYQPKIELATGRIVGAEALMRWRNAEGEAVSPAKFIPIAEESGLIVELGNWALEQACAEAARWPGLIGVAVNVSPIQLSLTDVNEAVFLALTKARLSARRLEIELTESAFVERETSIAKTLLQLREAGVTVALDDFGTGYSSLHYLSRLPIDRIKIDQSFTRRMEADASAAATVEAIVALARAHGKPVIAEGVATLGQARILADMACEYGQGYLFGKPLDAVDFRALLARQQREGAAAAWLERAA